jgi:hypothetical protein
MLRLSLYACLAFLVAAVGFAPAQTPTYAVTSAGLFGTLDLDTGDFTAVGDIAAGGTYSGIGNLADGTLVGVDGVNNFVQIDAGTGAITVIGPTGINVTTSASLLTGEQYAIDDQNNLYQIDPCSGAATLVGPTGIPGIDLNTFGNALAGDDAGNLYYIYEQAGAIPVPSTVYQLDLTRGQATAIGLTGVSGIAGAGFADGVLYAYSASTGNEIYTVDTSSGAATDTGVGYSSSFYIYGSNPGGAP